MPKRQEPDVKREKPDVKRETPDAKREQRDAKRKKRDLHQELTDHVIALLRSKRTLWSVPWAGTLVGLPQQHDGTYYDGDNAMELWAEAKRRQYRSPVWLTKKRAKKLGGELCEDEEQNGTVVEYWHRLHAHGLDDEDSCVVDARQHGRHFVERYTVFNAEQFDGLPARMYAKANLVAKSRDKRDLDLDRDFGAYILRSGVALPPGEDDLYDPYEDGIGVQNLDSTTRHGGNHYYWRLARAIILSTGHHERLDRKTMAGSSSSTDDSWEALIATIGATMLCAALGMAPVDCAIVDSIRIESGEHDQRWRVRWQWLSGSKYRLVKAATQAQEAADYVLDVIRGVVDPTAKRAKKRRRDAESESE